MVTPKSKTTKGGKFVVMKDEQDNPVVKFKQKTTIMQHDIYYREWKVISEKTEVIPVEQHSPKFHKKLSFSMVWKRNLQIQGVIPYGLGIKKYEYLTRKVTVAVKPDFWSVYLFCETFGIPKRKMSSVQMRDFFHTFGFGCGEISYSKTKAGDPLRVHEGKWKVITEEKANEIYSTGKARLVGRIVEEEDGTTTYSFGGEL